MAVNLDKPHLWKQDTQASVDYYNKWFMKFAPKAFRETRIGVTEQVEKAVVDTDGSLGLTPDRLRLQPGILPTLRMLCCPPLAVDRLVGLASTDKNLVKNLEKGRLAVRMSEQDLASHLKNIVRVIKGLLDPDIFVWLGEKRKPTREERRRASTIVADRLCSAVASDTVRSERKIQQLSVLSVYLDSRGYREIVDPGRRMYFDWRARHLHVFRVSSGRHGKGRSHNWFLLRKVILRPVASGWSAQV